MKPNERAESPGVPEHPAIADEAPAVLRSVRVGLPHGIHARPAALIVTHGARVERRDHTPRARTAARARAARSPCCRSVSSPATKSSSRRAGVMGQPRSTPSSACCAKAASTPRSRRLRRRLHARDDACSSRRCSARAGRRSDWCRRVVRSRGRPGVCPQARRARGRRGRPGSRSRDACTGLGNRCRAPPSRNARQDGAQRQRTRSSRRTSSFSTTPSCGRRHVAMDRHRVAAPAMRGAGAIRASVEALRRSDGCATARARRRPARSRRTGAGRTGGRGTGTTVSAGRRHRACRRLAAVGAARARSRAYRGPVSRSRRRNVSRRHHGGCGGLADTRRRGPVDPDDRDRHVARARRRRTAVCGSIRRSTCGSRRSAQCTRREHASAPTARRRMPTAARPMGAASRSSRTSDREADAALAVQNGAEGCGLLRTEFLFLDRKTAPAVAEQAAHYQRIVDAFGGRPVVIRTLDAGGDKPIEYLPLPREENPALGLRGVRTSLWQPALLRAQLARDPAAAPLGAVPHHAADGHRDRRDPRRAQRCSTSCCAELGIRERPRARRHDRDAGRRNARRAHLRAWPISCRSVRTT